MNLNKYKNSTENQNEIDDIISLNDFKNMITDIKNQITTQMLAKLNESYDKVEKMMKYMREKEKQLEIKCLNYEKFRRRKNLIIKGLTECETNSSDLERSVLELINNELQIKLSESDIDIVCRLGFKKTNFDRPIILKLTSEKIRNEIFKKKYKLKGSNIFIDPDLPKEILRRQYEQRKKNREQSSNRQRNQFIVRHQKSQKMQHKKAPESSQ
jgi:hypothetical protein